MKTIAITIPYGMSVRNILRSDMLDTLSKNARVLILSPYANDPAFKAEFDRPNVFIEALKFENNFGTKILGRIMEPVETMLFTEKTRIETLINLRAQLKALNPFRYLRFRIQTFIFGWQPLIGVLRKAYIHYLRSPYYEEIFDRYKVDLVFIANPFNSTDQQVAVTAHERRLPLIGMVHSWDNPSSKAGVRLAGIIDTGRTIPIKFNRFIVWNEVLRQELVDYYGYTPSQIDISGIPQFDIYARRDRITPRDSFLKSIGADPKKKLIVHAVGSPSFVPHPDQIIEILMEIIRSGRLGEPAQMLVRYHPNKSVTAVLKNLERKYAGANDLFFQNPSSSYAAVSDTPWNSKSNDEYELANSLAAADVVVTMGSTIALDSAALDRPIINLGFDGYQNEPYFKSIRRMYDYTHYKKVMQSGACTLANNPQELEQQIKRYFSDPGLESEGRRKLTKLQCFQLDGQSGRRVAESALKMS